MYLSRTKRLLLIHINFVASSFLYIYQSRPRDLSRLSYLDISYIHNCITSPTQTTNFLYPSIQKSKKKAMPLHIHPATPRDSAHLTTVFLAAFSDPFNLTLFPRTPDVRAWWENKFAGEAGAPGRALLKVVNTPDASSSTGGNEGGEEGEIAAFAIWKFPKDQSRKKQKEGDNEEGVQEEECQWPKSSDPNLCQRFFGGMAAKREEYMGSKPHYCTSCPPPFLHAFMLCISHSCIPSLHVSRISTSST